MLTATPWHRAHVILLTPGERRPSSGTSEGRSMWERPQEPHPGRGNCWFRNSFCRLVSETISHTQFTMCSNHINHSSLSGICCQKQAFRQCQAQRQHVHGCEPGVPAVIPEQTCRYHGNSGELVRNMAAGTWSVLRLACLQVSVFPFTHESAVYCARY